MTDTVVVEGQVRLREGKKWKNRWVLLRKPSPVADCLSLLVYKDRSDKSKGHRERIQATLGEICGLEALQGFEGMSYTLTVLCLSQSITLGFESKENLLAWDSRIRYSLGEVHRFTVNVQPGTKLESGPAILHLCNNLLVIARDIPPSIIGQWRLSDLRRYGAVPNGFVFEGGTRCGYWTGVFFLACAEGEQISFLFDCIARGISPSRAPFGLRPTLPELNSSSCSVEERVSQEAIELEKRLSLLSVCSRHSSTASHSSYSTSLAGDDRSISSSSSDTSRSDTSLSSRMAVWSDSLRYPPTPSPSSPSLSGATTPKPLDTSVSAFSDERLYGAVMGALRPPSKPPPLRGLQEAGRQSSTDSGIATASHSSYSGSFSSYTGSLDTGQVEADEFGSLFSLVQNTTPNLSGHLNTNPNLDTGHRNLSHFKNFYSTSSAPENRPVCVCPISGVNQEQDLEYQVPGHVLQRYDSPRRLVQLHPLAQDSAAAPDHRHESGLMELSGISKTPSMRLSGSTERIAPSVGSNMPRHIICPLCGGLKVISSAPVGFPTATVQLNKPKNELRTCSMTTGAEIINTDITEAEERGRFELMSSCKQQKSLWKTEGCASAMPPFPMSSLGLFRQSSFSDPKGNYVCMSFSMEPSRRAEISAREDGHSYVSDRLQADSANYVNIPVSPTSKRQLHYMELDLQDILDTGHTVRGAPSTKYAHIDITATETAQRVGAQHAQGRLQELEQRKRTTLN